MGTVSQMGKDKRRDYGEGSIFQRKDGMWIGRLEHGWDANGRRRRVQVSAKTEPECKRRLVKKRRAIESGAAPELSSRETVKSWADTWLAVQAETLSPNTHADYASRARKWIVPTIGATRLADLTPGHVRSVSQAEQAAGIAASTQVTTRRILTKMLRDAILEGHPVPPRVLEVKAHRPPKSDRDAIPLPDAGEILTASLALPHTSRWIVGFFEGIRQGEALGLTWDHVDLKKGTIHVEYQLDTLPYLDREAGTFRHPKSIKPVHLWRSYHLVPTKSTAGERIIPIVGPALVALRQWKKAAPRSPHGLVWPRPGGRPMNETHDTAEWIALQDAARVAHFDGKEGRRYTGHEIRHTTATLLLEIGADPRTVEQILGHSSIITSRGYQHVSQELARETMEKVAERLAFKLPERRGITSA